MIKKTIQIVGLILFLFSGTIYAQDPLRWEETIQKYEKKDSLNPVEDGALLFVGSSSIAIWQDIGEYFPDYYILNRGFGGSHFSDLIHYADRIIYPYKPKKIFIYEGDNDIAADEDPKDIFAEAKKLRKMISENLPGVPVAFISAKPAVARWDYKDQYRDLNSRLKKFAEKTPDTEFIDVWDPALDEEGEVYKHIFLEDSLHMNHHGYEIWKNEMEPYLVK